MTTPESAAGQQSLVPVKQRRQGLVPAELSSDGEVADFFRRLLALSQGSRGDPIAALVPWVCDRLPSVNSRRAYFRELAAFTRHLRAVGVEPLAVTGDDIRLYKAALAADPQVHRDLPYAESKNERQILDVYSPAEGKDHAVVVWIHGGGWNQGQKAGVQKKPQAFVDKGFVFVSINYRFVPKVTMKQMAGDVAKAIHWVHDHAKDYGGDPDSIFVMGHSGGAHLAALICTDDRYLKAEGLSLPIIKGCVPVDVGFYDVPKLVKDSGQAAPDSFKEFFGGTEEVQRDLSPVAHVSKDKNIPPFLIMHCADRPGTKAQSEWFAEKLQNNGVPAKVIAAEGKTHGTINSDLGLPDDKPTQAMWEFLDGVLKK